MTQAFLKIARIAPQAFLAAAAVISVSSPAQAVVDSGWDRPIVQSRMDIVQAHPEMANAQQVELIMTRKDGAPSVTGITLRIDRQAINFDIAKIKHDVCGTQLYIGMTSADAPEHSYRVVVVDHSRENCTPASSGGVHALPVKPSLEALLLDRNEPLLQLTGEPEAVLTPQ